MDPRVGVSGDHVFPLVASSVTLQILKASSQRYPYQKPKPKLLTTPETHQEVVKTVMHVSNAILHFPSIFSRCGMLNPTTIEF